MRQILLIIFISFFTTTIYAQYEFAEKAFREKDYPKVVSLCSEVSPGDPDYESSIILVGMSYQEMQDYQKALDVYNSADTIESVTMKYLKAECFELLGDSNSANAIYETVYESDSSNYHSLRNIARISLKKRDYRKAESYYKILCDTFPTNYLYKKNLGTCYYNTKNEIKALDNFRWAWQLNKRDLTLPISIANVYAIFQAPDNALEILQEGYALDSLNIPILKTMAYINYKLEKYDSSINYFQKSIAAGDSSVFTHKNIGISLLKKNRIIESEPHLRIFFQDDTLNSEASYYLGLALSTLHKKEEGIKLLHYTVDLMNPDSTLLGSIYASIGRTWSDINSCVNSTEAYEKATDYDPKKPEYILDLAKMYDQLGRTENSVVDYKLAVKTYNEFNVVQHEALKKIRIERGLGDIRMQTPGTVYADERIAAIKKELFFLGELEK